MERPQDELEQLWALAGEVISQSRNQAESHDKLTGSECRGLGAALGPLAVVGGEHFEARLRAKLHGLFGNAIKIGRVLDGMEHASTLASGQLYGEWKPLKRVQFTVETEVYYENDRRRSSRRWREIEVVKTAKGSFVLRKGYRSQWQGEKWYDRYFADKSLEALRRHLSPVEDIERKALDDLELGYEIEEI